MHTRVACDHEQAPLEGVGAVIVASGVPAQDLAVDVLFPWIRAAHRLAVFAALGVVGQGAIDLAVDGADDDPLRAVHARGLDHAGRQTGMNQHFGLAGKAAVGVDAMFAETQLDPLARALGPVRVAVAVVEARSRLALGFLWLILSRLMNL